MAERRSLPHVAMDRPVTTVMIAVAALVLGVVAWGRIPLDFIPAMTRPEMWAMMPYPNATPEEVERRVVKPMEEELRTIAGLRKLRAYAYRDGARFGMEFDWRTHMRVAYLDVRERFEILRRSMPPEARRYYLWKANQADIPIVWGVLSWPGATSELFRLADTRVKSVLERQPGVAIVDMHGTSEPQVQIELDQQRLQAYGVDPYALIGRLREYHVSVSAGAIREGDRQLIVRAVDTYRSPDDIANIQISPTGLRLAEVADVYYGYPAREFIGRINGANAVSFAVRKESTANTVETADRVTTALDRLTEDKELQGLGYQTFLNQGDEIRKAVVGLRKAGLWGGLLAVLMLLAFLRRWRMTLLIAAAIPLSLLVTVAALFLLGRTLNIISMLGLMLAVGALVDNSVVVVENIVRLRQNGVAAREAAARGAAQVGMAIAAATATSVVVFVPLIFTRGEFRVYLRELGLALGLSLVASLCVALTLVPLAAARLLHGAAPVRTAFGEWTARAYTGTVRWVLRHPWIVAAGLIGVLVATEHWPGHRIRRSMRPHGTMRQAQIDIHVGFPGSNLRRTEELFARIEQYLDERREALEIKTVFTFTGRDNDRLRVFIAFKEPPESATPVEQLLERLSAAMPAWPEADMRIAHIDEDSDRRTFTVRVIGDGDEIAARLVRELKPQFSALPSVRQVDDGSITDQPEVTVRVDRDRILRAGLDSNAVGGVLAFALRGTRLPSLQLPDGEVEVWTQLEPDDRRDQATLGDLRLAAPDGRSVALRSVAGFEPSPSPHRIERIDGRRERSLQVTTVGMAMSDARKSLSAVIENAIVPPGFDVKLGDRFDEFGETQRDMQLAVLLGIVLIYIVLASLFESLLSPLLILISVPLALVGSLWVMQATDAELDMATGVGLVLLIGIVANNGIVIVDRINQLRQEGLSVPEAVIAGGEQRLRPVFMTAFTTVLGLLPLAFGDASLFGGEVMFAPVGRVVIGGLIASTLLVLVLVPGGYVLLWKLQGWAAAVLAAVCREGPSSDRRKAARSIT